MRKPSSRFHFSAVAIFAGRYAAFAVAILCLLGSPIHGLIQRHTYCAQHGELSHVGAGSAVNLSALKPISNRAGTLSTNWTPLQSHGEHEHCELFFQRRESVSALGSARVEIAAAGAESSVFLIEAVSLPVSTPLLAIAPKNSPPLA